MKTILIVSILSALKVVSDNFGMNGKGNMNDWLIVG